MTLVTPRLVLRAARQSDLDDLFAIYSHPDAMRYWSTPPHDDRAATQENLDRLIASARKRLVYAVFELRGKVIGLGGLHQNTEIGFLMHPDHWRKDYAQEAMRRLIPHIFDVTEVAELTADVDPRNKASRGLLKSLGFQETRHAQNTYCINGVSSDSVYYALPRPTAR